MHRYARDMHDICTHMHRYIHFPLGYAAKWTCMYLHVFYCICMYPCCMSREVHICMYMHLCVCICMYFQHVHIRFQECICAKCMYLYVSCMYIVCICFFCMYLVCICMYHVCVCMACISPNKYSGRHNLAKWPASGPASRRPHSEQWWAGAHLLCSSIQDNMSDPICCTAARSTRRGGPTRVQGVTNRPPMCINTLVIPS